MKTARMLASDGIPRFERFPEQVEQLVEMLNNREFEPPLTPRLKQPPPVWMLGSSPESAILAARLGLPYNFALFINSNIDLRILEFYRRYFEPSTQHSTPKTCIAINVICAETEAEARRLSLSRDLLFARFATGQPSKVVPTVEEAESYQFSEAERAFLDDKFRLAAVGAPGQVKNIIDQLVLQFGADEVMAVTLTHDFEARLNSYELLSGAYR